MASFLLYHKVSPAHVHTTVTEKECPFKKIVDLTTAGDWDCVAAVERLPALHYSVDFIFLSFGVMVSLWNFETIRGSMVMPKWLKLASPVQKICTL